MDVIFDNGEPIEFEHFTPQREGERNGLGFNFENPNQNSSTPRPRILPEYLREPRETTTRRFSLFHKYDDRGDIWPKIGIGILAMLLTGMLLALVVCLGIAIYQGMGIWGLIVSY